MNAPVPVVVVIELGTRYIKCGFSGEAFPRSYHRPVARGQWRSACSGALVERRALLDAVEVELRHVYFGVLLCSPSSRAAALVAAPFSCAAVVGAAAEVLRARFGATAVRVVEPLGAVAALLGRSRCLFVDVSWAAAVAFPLCDGVALEAAQVVGSGGARAAARQVAATDNGEGDESELERLGVCKAAEDRAVNALLHGVEEEDAPGLVQLVLKSIERAPVDLRVELAAGIVLLGGGAMAPGLAGRLQGALRRSGGKTYTQYARVVEDTVVPPNILLWVGGSIESSGIEDEEI